MTSIFVVTPAWKRRFGCAILLGQLVTKVADINGRACGVQIIERGFYFADNAVFEGTAVFRDTLLFELLHLRPGHGCGRW